MLIGKLLKELEIEIKILDYALHEYEKQLNKITAPGRSDDSQKTVRAELMVGLEEALNKPIEALNKSLDKFYSEFNILQAHPVDSSALEIMKESVKELQKNMLEVRELTAIFFLPKFMDKLYHKIETILIKIHNILFAGHHYTAVYYAGYVPEKHNITTCHQEFFRTSNNIARLIGSQPDPEVKSSRMSFS